MIEIWKHKKLFIYLPEPQQLKQLDVHTWKIQSEAPEKIKNQKVK